MSSRVPCAALAALLSLAAPVRALDPFPAAAKEDTARPHGPRRETLDPVLTKDQDPLAVALAALRLKPSDITFRTDGSPPGPHRRAIVDRVLTDPHQLEPEVRRAATALLAARADPRALVTEACRLADLPMPEVRVPEVGIDDAVARFCALPLAELDTGSRVTLARLRGLPAGFRAALAGLLAAHAEARDAMAREAARFTPAEVDFLAKEAVAGDAEDHGPAAAERLLALAARLDRARPVAALASVATAARAVVAAVRALTPGQLTAIASSRLEGRAGAFFLGGPGPDRTGAHDMLVVDVGGDDLHDLCDARDPHHGFGQVRTIVDVAGDDRYFARDLPLAGGFCGVGLVWDGGGDDLYDAGANALGSAVMGAGMLVDEGGDDHYTCGVQGEGAALFGIGLLVDLAGNDTYHARGAAQGYGAPGGVGLLVDHSGHDAYCILGGSKDFRGDFTDSFGQGFGVGFRDQASGGIGGLVDGGGNDTYTADYWAQGVGYWYGLGFLVDRAGRDRYTAGRYAQGAGVHFALGALLDDAGDDEYVATAVAQGTGYDHSAGLLHDRDGNDVYVAHDFAQGCGFANGYGLLRDDRGSDAYFAWAFDAQGYGSWANGYGSVGVHLDLGGLDRYLPEGRNNTLLTRGDTGVLLDAPLNP